MGSNLLSSHPWPMSDPSTALDIPMTARLRREARRWEGAPRPANIVPAGPGQESVWDYPRPPALHRVAERAEVFLGDVRIADSTGCLRALETAGPPTVYVPANDVVPGLLVPERGRSACEWKGTATYYGARTGETTHPQVAWSYLDPHPEYAALAGFIAFYPRAPARCVYGGRPVRPQPGHFYGGWITDNLVGPFKGEPGSQGW